MGLYPDGLVIIHDKSLSPEPIHIQLEEINGQKMAHVLNPGPMIKKQRDDHRMARAIGVEELEYLEWGGHYREEALDEIQERANKAFDELIDEGYEWEEALRIARKRERKELDYLEFIQLDKNGLLRRERINAFDEIEQRERAKRDRKYARSLRAESARDDGTKKKFRWPWQKCSDAAMA